jgi:sugar phosphate isomerase/epimerase
MLSFAFVSDEICADFSETIQHGLSWGVTRYEMRMLPSGRVPDITAGDIAAVRRAIKDHGVRITALSPGSFKLAPEDREGITAQLREPLPRTLDLALELGAPLVIIFGFMRSGKQDEHARAVDAMQRAVDLASAAGIVLAVENEPGFLCDSGSNTAAFIDAVASPFLKANWDPANAVGTGERPWPEGYAALKRHVVNIHAKDTVEGSLVRCVPIGEGVVDWRGQLRAANDDGIVEHISIETHCLPLLENSRKNLEVLRGYLGGEMELGVGSRE